ncbi:MAG: NlpC/P60 family protein [Anaerotardibacter sp.]
MTSSAMSVKNKAIAGVLSVLLAVGICIPLSSASATPSISEQASAARAQLNEINSQVEAAAERYNEAMIKIDEANAKIEEETAIIEKNQSRLSSRARSMYRSGSTSFIDYLLGVSSFEEFATTWELLDMLNEEDAELISETKEARQIIEEQKVVLEEQAEEAKKEKEQAEAKVAELEALVASLDAQVLAEVAAQQEAEEAANAISEEDITNRQQNGSSSSGGSSNSGYSSPSSGNSSAVSIAYSLIGKPYQYGAAGPDSFDCSGFVGYCLAGGRIGTTATFNSWPTSTNPQPGDVVVVHNGSRQHCGIYIGNGQYIHAPQTGDYVKVSSVTSDMKIVHQ